LPGAFVGGKPHAGDSTVAEERSRIYFSLCWIDYFADQERLLLDALAILNLSERSGSPVGVPLGFAWISALCNVIPHFRLASYYSRRAVALADHIQHPIPISVAHHLAAFHRYYVGDWTGAVEHYGRSIAAYRQTGDLRGWAAINGFMYGLCRYRGRYSESLEQAAELIRVGQESADHHAWGWGLQILGFIEGRAGPVDHAIGHLQRALELFRAIPAYPSVAEALGDLGHCYLGKGEWKQALTVLEECHKLIRARGLRGHEVTSPYHALAEAYLAAIEHTQGAARAAALHSAQNACRVALKHGAAFVGGIPRAMRLQGTCSWLSNQPDAAEKWWRRGLAVAEKLGASYDLGMTYMEMGTRLQDRHHLERAVDLFREIGATRDLGTAYRLLGEAVLGTSQLETAALDAAAPYFETSTSTLSAIKAEYELALAYTGYARLRKRQGRLAEAHDHRTRALDIFARLGTPIEPGEARAELAELSSG
jgi:tetratricopeptide (TPR) repeat protein